MPKKLNLVKILFLIGMICVTYTATSSIAEEIRLTNIIPEAAVFSTYVIGDIDADLTINEGNADWTWTTFHTIPWVAPRSGMILIIWHHPGVSVSAPAAGASGIGTVVFSVELSGNSGILNTGIAEEEINRFIDGYVPWIPIVDRFSVVQGTPYTIDLQYIARHFSNLEAELLNSPGKRSIIEITYVDTP